MAYQRLSMKYIVAISGGADSTALLHMLVAAGHTCVGAHCNYGLRGDESLRDEQAARSLCERLGVEAEVRRFKVEPQPRESVEMACRRLRYEWFEELRVAHGADAIAVGHHLDDQAETFMLNLMRGTGLRGLAGMRPERGHVVRPLLGMTRQAVEQYCRDHSLPWVTDSSNLQCDYRRNRLRNVVLPALRSQFGDGADAAIAATMAHLAEARDLLEETVEAKRRLYTLPDGSLDVGRLVAEEPSSHLLLHEMLPGAPVDDIIRAALAGRSGRRFGPWVLDRGRLVDTGAQGAAFEPAPEVPTEEEVMVAPGSGPFDWDLREGNSVDAASLSRWQAAFDADMLEGDPRLTLGPWRRGERLAPYGMQGTKLVSHLLRDAKVPLHLKPQVMVLRRNGRALWVPGIRASRLYAVTGATRRHLVVTYRPGAQAPQ